MLFISSASIVFIRMLFLYVCVLGLTHPVKNGCIIPGPRSHCASYSGFQFVCWSQAVSVRDGALEELPGVMARLVQGFASRFSRRCASPAVARFGIPRVSQGFPAGIPGEAVLADSRGPKLLVQLES